MDPIIPHLGEELLISLLTTEQTDDEHAGAVDGEQSTDTVELAAEDFEHHQGKRELRQSRANIGAFESPLRGPDFDNLVGGQGHRTSPVQAETVTVSGATL